MKCESDSEGISGEDNTGNSELIDESVVQKKLESVTRPANDSAVNVSTEEVPDERKEIVAQKIRNSIFLSDGCCATSTEPEPCCCDEVVTHFASLIAAEEWEKVSNARSTDVILKDCMQIDSIRKKIELLELGDEEF
jgi:hypothetical protein